MYQWLPIRTPQSNLLLETFAKCDTIAFIQIFGDVCFQCLAFSGFRDYIILIVSDMEKQCGG